MTTADQRIIDTIAATLARDGWTCEYHEPDDECSQCRESHLKTAVNALAALRSAGIEPVEPSPPADLRTISHDMDRHVAGWDVDGGDGRIELRVDIFRRIHMEGMEYTPAEVRALLPALLAAAQKAEELK